MAGVREDCTACCSGDLRSPEVVSTTDMKPRLHRLERLFVDHPVYYVTLCIEDRCQVLNNSPVHQAVMAFGAQGVDRNCWMGRYVLMPDHLHAFVAFGLPEMSTRTALSAWVKAFKGTVSKVWREGGVAHARWQKGFFDHLLRSSESYSEKWLYVVQNPVRAGLVKQWEDWPYQGESYRLEL